MIEAEQPKPISLAAPVVPAGAAPAAARPNGEFAQAAGNLLDAGLKFLEALAGDGDGKVAGAPAERLQRVAAVLVRPDPRSQRPTLSIPLPEWFTPEALGGAISGLFSRLSGTP